MQKDSFLGKGRSLLSPKELDESVLQSSMSKSIILKYFHKHQLTATLGIFQPSCLQGFTSYLYSITNYHEHLTGSPWKVAKLKSWNNLFLPGTNTLSCPYVVAFCKAALFKQPIFPWSYWLQMFLSRSYN